MVDSEFRIRFTILIRIRSPQKFVRKCINIRIFICWYINHYILSLKISRYNPTRQRLTARMRHIGLSSLPTHHQLNSDSGMFVEHATPSDTSNHFYNVLIFLPRNKYLKRLTLNIWVRGC